MIKKLIFLNLALLALVAFLAHKLNADLNKFRAQHNINRIKAEAAANAKKAAGKKAAPPNSVVANMPQPAQGEYNVIFDKNLFSETRTLEKDVPIAVKPQPPELNPKPTLYGIVEDSSGRWALVEDTVQLMGPPVGPPLPGPHPVRPPVPVASQRKSVIKLKLGDVYHSYKVTEISDDRVTLTYGDNEKIEYIPLFDKNKPRQVAGMPGRFPPQPAPVPVPVTPVSSQVVTIGGNTGAKPGTPGQAGVGYPPPQPIPPGVTPGTSSSSSVTSIPSSTATAASSGTTSTTVQPGGTAPANTTPAHIREREITKGGKKYIRTPFGDVPKDN